MAIIGPRNEAVPAVTNYMSSGAIDVAGARQRGQDAVAALVVSRRILLTGPWPTSVAKLCRSFGASSGRILVPLQRLAHASTLNDLESAFNEFERARGPLGPNNASVVVPEAREIRKRLGLPFIG